ncbi:luciferase family protein [Streptomyces xanthochromogenes]|uniref:luciferase domain-containing protein n=2 Tax=Streptomyces TaxID=1883 RepID=UPI001422EF3F|nr:luciferase family protein [Streptomyces xanthochromogenes]
MTAAHRAMDQLESWPNLVTGPPRCAVGRALFAAECEVVHFHSGFAADLHLTHPAIERLRPELRHSTAIRLKPGSAWVTVLLDCGADVDLLLTLVSMALKAQALSPPNALAAPCTWYRPAVPPQRVADPPVLTLGPRPGVLPAARRAVGRFLPHGPRAV